MEPFSEENFDKELNQWLTSAEKLLDPTSS